MLMAAQSWGDRIKSRASPINNPRTFWTLNRPYPPQMIRSSPSMAAANSLLGAGSSGRSEVKTPHGPQELMVATAGWRRLSTSPPSSNTTSEINYSNQRMIHSRVTNNTCINSRLEDKIYQYWITPSCPHFLLYNAKLSLARRGLSVYLYVLEESLWEILSYRKYTICRNKHSKRFMQVRWGSLALFRLIFFTLSLTLLLLLHSQLKIIIKQYTSENK